MSLALSAALTLAASTLQPAPAPVSDPTLVYARVEQVELLPTPEAPERLVVHGAFSVAEGRGGGYYRSPQWGTMAFVLPEERRSECLVQWKDLARLAGADNPVGFGSRNVEVQHEVHPRGSADVVARPFPLGWAVREVEHARYGMLAVLDHLPRPEAPAPDARVTVTHGRRRGQNVTLSAGVCARPEDGDRYLFSIERANGDALASPPIRPVDGRVEWEVFIGLTPGDEVEWTVRLLREDLDVAPVAGSRFRCVQEG